MNENLSLREISLIKKDLLAILASQDCEEQERSNLLKIVKSFDLDFKFDEKSGKWGYRDFVVFFTFEECGLANADRSSSDGIRQYFIKLLEKLNQISPTLKFRETEKSTYDKDLRMGQGFCIGFTFEPLTLEVETKEEIDFSLREISFLKKELFDLLVDQDCEERPHLQKIVEKMELRFKFYEATNTWEHADFGVFFSFEEYGSSSEHSLTRYVIHLVERLNEISPRLKFKAVTAIGCDNRTAEKKERGLSFGIDYTF